MFHHKTKLIMLILFYGLIIKYKNIHAYSYILLFLVEFFIILRLKLPTSSGCWFLTAQQFCL